MTFTTIKKYIYILKAQRLAEMLALMLLSH